MAVFEIGFEEEAPQLTAKYERTPNKYPSVAPGGESWEEYFKTYAEARHAAKGPEEEGDDEEQEALVTVTTPGHEVEEGWPKPLSTYRTTAIKEGWDFKMGHCAYHVGDVWLVDGSAIRYKAKNEAHWWINATRGGRYLTVTYTVKEDGTTAKITRTMSDMWGLIPDAQMKKEMKRADPEGTDTTHAHAAA